MATNTSTIPPGIPDTTNGRLPFSPALLGLTQLLLFVSLILPPSIPQSTRKWLFLPIFIITMHLIFRTTSGDVLKDVGIGPVLAGQLGQALDFLILCDPRSAFKLKTKDAEGKAGDGGPGDTLLSRIKWAGKLLSSTRGIGWTHEPPAHVLPPRKNCTRTQFVIAKLIEALRCLLIESIAYIFTSTNPALTTTTTSIRDYPLKMQVIGVVCIAAAAYARINIGHAVAAAVAVGSGVSEPEDWPNLFGGIREMWCIGRFWSRTWHHLLRRTLTSTTNTLLPPTHKSLPIFAFLRLLTAFLTSAIIHLMGDYMLTGHLHPGAFIFFTLQPFGILFERILFSQLGVNFYEKDENLKPRLAVRVVGYVWVMGWFTWTAPIMLDTMVGAGVFVHRSGNVNLGAGVVDWWFARGGEWGVGGM